MQNRVWEPKNAFMEEYLKQWQNKLAVKNEMAQWQRPQWGNITAPPPDTMQPLGLPSVTKVRAKPQEVQPVEVPFWQRALQVFAAPFEWVDENVIRPGLAVGATSVGAIKDLPRKAGEDYFEWKKRSWDEWNAPGVDFKALWGEGDWRIDIKGVMEFAPWFLIPGAGQVGTATRAARGIAGVLGKAGMAGRALGLAVELSPWGLVEKTAGAAFRGVAKATGKVTGKVGERFVGKIPEPTPPPESVSKFTKFVKDTVIPKRKEFEIELKAMRSRQEIGGEEFLERAARGEMGNWEAVQLAAAARSGGVKSQFAVPLAEAVTRADVDDMLGMIVRGSETNLVKIDSAVALQEFFINGTLPMPHNLRDWAKVFGKEFADVVSSLKGVKPSVFEKTLDILNIPRAVLASADLSGFGRQGLILGLLHPTSVPRWFGRQLKAFYSEKMTVEMDAARTARPLYKELKRVGWYERPTTHKAPIGAMEESFASTTARAVPLVRRSERAFNTYLNEATQGAAEKAYTVMKAAGATDSKIKLMMDFINQAGGRGNLPAWGEKFAPALNTILFSPRLQMATLELPRTLGRMLLSKNPYMRKEAAKAFITFVGGGTAVLGLLNATGVSKVELDPRAGDFGKIKLGETRIDIWRGYLQYIRFVSQVMSGERKSAYGNLSKAERDDIAWRFLQSKSSPAFGLLVDLLKGENYMGEPLFEKTTGAIKTARNRFMPIAIQDIMDATEQSGINGAWTAAPAVLGAGVLTYVNDLVKVQNDIARDMGKEAWSEIDPRTRREIENSNKELQVAMIDFDRQVMGTAWGDWRLAGNAIEDVFKENVEIASAQYRATGDGYQFRNKITDAYTARRGGYDARDKEARFEEIVRRNDLPDTAEKLLALGPEQTAIKAYTDALFGDDMYDEFGDYRFDEAETRKEQLMQSLGQEMFDYVEQYRGLKEELLPPEYQELAQAKKVMRPYWQVINTVTELFGKRFAESLAGQRLIAKRRKLLRATNPEIEKYYQMFYAQK